MPPMYPSAFRPPNTTDPGNRKANGFLPLVGSGSPADPSNLSRFQHGDPGGSANLTKLASQFSPPNDGQFRGGDKGLTPDMEFPSSPGKGEVPVNPFLSSGGIAQASPQADSATTALMRDANAK